MVSQLKTFLRDTLGLPTWAVIASAGLVTHLVLNLVLRKSPTSPWGLLAPLTIGVLVEAYEIWIQYRSIGLFAPGNDPILVILARHGLDVLLMLALPILLVTVDRLITR